MMGRREAGVVQLCKGDDLLLAEVRARRTTDGGITRALSLLPYRGSWRAKPGEPTFSEADVVAFLAAPPGAQLRLPLEMVGWHSQII